MAEDKGFQATPKKLERARRDGKVLKSPLLTQSISAVSVLVVAWLSTHSAWVRNRMLLEYCWSAGMDQPLLCSVGMGRVLLETVLPSLIFGALVSILVEALQVGLRFESQLLAFRATAFTPENGLKKIAVGVRDSWQSGLRLLGFVLVFTWSLSDSAPMVLRWFRISSESQLFAGAAFVTALCCASFLLCAFFAGMEYFLRRRSFYRELSMSLDELKREHREDCGDPQTKAQRQALHRSMSYEEIVQRTRRSKVIIVEAGGTKGE